MKPLNLLLFFDDYFDAAAVVRWNILSLELIRVIFAGDRPRPHHHGEGMFEEEET
jgi:hypothetical protein